MEKENKSILKKENKKEDSLKVRTIKYTILVVIALILFSAVLTPVTFQNDTYYTIKIGEHIIQTGGVDMQDPFSWHENLPYTYPHWAYDVMIYLIYNLAGFTGVFISTIIFSCILGVLIYFTNLKISKNRIVSFFITLGAMFLLKDYITARAQLITFILIELVILLIENFLEKKKKRYAIGIILISILLANLHCTVWPFLFIIFLPYIAEYIFNIDFLTIIHKIKKGYFNNRIKKYTKKSKNQKIEKISAKILEDDKRYEKELINRKERRDNPYKIKMVKILAVKWLILIMVICGFTGLLTPLKDTPYTSLYKLMQGNTTDSINEHLPLTLINNKEILIVLTGLIAFLIFTDTKIRLKDLFMLAGLILLMFMTRRQESMFVLLGSASIAKMIAELFEKYDKNGTAEFEKIMTSTLGTIATLLVIALIMILEIKTKINDKYVNTSAYPVQAAEYIKENIDISKMRLFNEYNYGSYLLFKEIPVFIDSRADLYSPEFNDGQDIFSDYINTSNISKDYEKTFEEYDITHIILTVKSKLNMLISKDKENYKELYKDEKFIIYERNVD